MAPQQVEKIGFAPGNGMVPESREATRCSKGARGWPCANPQERQVAKGTKGHEKGAQRIEIARCKTEIGACRRRRRRAGSLARDRPRGYGGGLFELTAELQKFGAHGVRFGRLVTR